MCGIAIRPILTYGSSTWTLTKTAEGKLDAAERRFLRRIVGYKWSDKIRNTELNAEVRGATHNAEVSKLSDVVRKERLKLLGHVMRRSDERPVKMALLHERIPAWTRPRGRSSQIWKDLIKADLLSTGFESVVHEATKIYGHGITSTWRSKIGRDLWKEMSGNNGREGTRERSRQQCTLNK
ncbi:hypothetical protein AB6A40_008545 [Gnathostoma spinigerum]|uniref:Endonuclease-reverse transcriptase n=1 Tax=Gnathostoma spinigerum TaxID=75299 RepID=A0ABD6EWG7_9BILA